MSVRKKIVTIFLDVLICFFLSALILYTISMINSRWSKYSLPGVAGVSFLVVKSGSMEPAIKTGDLLLVTKPETANLKAGDIISYFNDGGELITHRIVKVENEAFSTKGDANNVNDSSMVPADRIAGMYAARVPYLGYVFGYAKTKVGIVVCLIIPSLIILGYALVMIVDEMHNSSRHRKKILRKRRRRMKRYSEEGMDRMRMLM